MLEQHVLSSAMWRPSVVGGWLSPPQALLESSFCCEAVPLSLSITLPCSLLFFWIVYYYPVVKPNFSVFLHLKQSIADIFSK